MMKNYSAIQLRNLIPSYSFRGITIVKGEGVYLYDQSGKKYLDLMSNIGVNVLGHNNKYLNDCLKNQIDKLISLHCSFANDVRSEMIEKLLSFLPYNLKRVYLCSTGTETIEAAIKFACVASGKTNFIAAQNAYHGKTLGALALTTSSNGKYQDSVKNLLPDFKYVEFGNIKDLEDKIDNNIAGIILEPIQGEGGIIVSPKGYLKKVREICDKKKIFLIFDEVQTGMGRTGKFLACEHENVTADILCLSKGLGGGIPIGITVVTEEIAEKIPKGTQTTTFGGNPLSCSASLAVLNFFEENKILDHVEVMGSYFIERLNNIKSNLIKEIKGRGLMIGICLNRNATPYLIKLQKKGVITAPSVPDTIRLLPPLIINKKEIDEAIKIIEEVLNE